MMTRFVLAFILLLQLDVIIALILVMLGLILVSISLLFRTPLKHRYHQRQNQEASVRSFLQEHIQKIPIIKAFRVEQPIATIHQQKQEDFVQAKVHYQNLSIFIGTGMSAIFMVVYASVILFGSWRIMEGVITIGSLIAILQLVDYLQSPFHLASTLVPALSAMEGAFERLADIKTYPKEYEEVLVPKQFSALTLSEVSYSYNNQKPVLKDLSINIKAQEVVLINGQSGIGKTTLLYLLLGLYQPQTGTMLIQDQDEIPIGRSSRGYFSYVPQQLDLFSGTITENVLYHRANIHPSLIEEACMIAQIHEDIIALPNGYQTILSENNQGLSLGQMQRLSIARALLGEEPILLLDECTSALDADTERNVLQGILKNTNNTILLVSHHTIDPSLIDQVITLP
jgi:ABC-type bacteriocin/lantibiotic exporter with double-glycine peptidase domain